MKRVLFVCVHNAGRSQMAEAILNDYATKHGLAVRASSAGTQAGTEINPAARAVVEELGISMQDQAPKLLTRSLVDSSDRVITMGCGVDAEACPARFVASDDWGLDDPAGQSTDEVRKIRDQIVDRIHQLVEDLSVETV